MRRGKRPYLIDSEAAGLAKGAGTPFVSGVAHGGGWEANRVHGASARVMIDQRLALALWKNTWEGPKTGLRSVNQGPRLKRCLGFNTNAVHVCVRFD